MNDLVLNFQLSSDALGYLTSAVQFGFISGTLIFALFSIADRYSPSKVFLISAMLGALFNVGAILASHTLLSLVSLRFMTGFFLAGIYPIGMKIAADYHEKGLGKALGFLVGALVLGTALPHLLKGFTSAVSWKFVIMTTSALALLGGSLTGFLVPDGPYRKSLQKLDLSLIGQVFKNVEFRSAAFGYFGHMWELYAYWAFIPFILSTYLEQHPEVNISVPVISFVIIAVGSLACVIGGYSSKLWGTKKTAALALALSGLCCLISPAAFYLQQPWIFITFLMFWGMVVIADSPLFSTLVAQSASPEFKGTALTIVNCIGFSITIISIQVINSMSAHLDNRLLYLLLSLGPVFGLISIFRPQPRHQNNE